MVLCHISHVYETGASLYFTVLCAQADDPIAQWQRRRPRPTRRSARPAPRSPITTASAPITARRISDEIGPLGVAMLRAAKARRRPGRHPQPRRAGRLTCGAFTALVNPISGGGTRPQRWAPLADRLGAAGADVRHRADPQPRARGRRRARDAAAEGGMVVAVGGDGLVRDVAEGVVGGRRHDGDRARRARQRPGPRARVPDRRPRAGRPAAARRGPALRRHRRSTARSCRATSTAASTRCRTRSSTTTAGCRRSCSTGWRRCGRSSRWRRRRSP